MNQRIRELAEQAGAVVDEGPLAFAVVFGEMTDFEKFAELIVRECIGMVENEASQYAEPVWAVELVNDIRDRFGVEE